MPHPTLDASPLHRTTRASKGMVGFTIVELLVVIGIIVVLISLLVPAVSKVRQKAQTAGTQAWMAQLSRAIDSYHTDFRAYPGPLKNEEINTTTFITLFMDTTIPATAGFDTISSPNFNQITMSENLVLGLLGGLKYVTGGTPQLQYDPRLVGNGPTSLATRGPVKRSEPYLEAKNLSWRTGASGKTGQYVDDGGAAKDSIIPEFMDTYPEPMPILYLRAKVGSPPSTASPVLPENNSVITYKNPEPQITDPLFRVGHYDLHQISGYTGQPLGPGGKVTVVNHPGPSPHGLSTVTVDALLNEPTDTSLTPHYQYPLDAYPYFRNQALSSPQEATAGYSAMTNRTDVPQQRDAYIIISAGVDRVFGTRDDLTNFGAIGK